MARNRRGTACRAPAECPTDDLPFDLAETSRRLLAWYGKNGRDLPWRRTRDPYRIWLSEVMLQQTGVATVIPYYERFLERFPTVSALATASPDEVIALWAGLGYYSRARHLHAAAGKVVDDHGGRFPDTLEGLTALPGVGRSTAGAILSIAFDRPAPILDGNVRRVLCRLFALEEDPRSAMAEKKLWLWAEALTPTGRPHDYAQAIMDLGATVCTPKGPACPDCPLLESLCLAHRQGMENDLPATRKRKPVPTVIQVALLLAHGGRVLVRRRPPAGLLGGLWEFPAAQAAEDETPQQAAQRLLANLGFSGSLAGAGQVRHAYSHFRLDLHLFRGSPASPERVAEEGESRWLEPGELESFPLHGAHRKALKYL